MNTIVFVEDDAEVGSLIAAYLAKHDMQVTVEPRGDRAEETILRENPDLVLLDIMLPGKDGMTICRDLRAKWSGPIVLLTSLDSDMNHILALEMGACDYILKTTPPAVLLARLRLHLRQNEQATVTKGIQETSLTPYKALHFGTLTIDPINRVVTLANTEISLSTADFELLWELATHAGQIMDRDALLKNLRGVSYDGLDRSVDVAISRLRKNCSITPQNLIVLKPCVTKAIFCASCVGISDEKTVYPVLPVIVCLLPCDVSAGRAGVQIYRRTRRQTVAG